MGRPKFEELLGKTLVKVESNVDESLHYVTFETKDGIYRLQGDRGECSDDITYIESVDGDLQDLVQAECVKSSHYNGNEAHETHQWCFYKLATVKGSVTICWREVNSGYYTVDVDFNFEGM